MFIKRLGLLFKNPVSAVIATVQGIDTKEALKDALASLQVTRDALDNALVVVSKNLKQDGDTIRSLNKKLRAARSRKGRYNKNYKKARNAFLKGDMPAVEDYFRKEKL